MFGPGAPTGDAEFTEFVRAATPSLSWTAYLLTGNREAAAELLQEAFVRTYLAWRRVRFGEAAVKSAASRGLATLRIEYTPVRREL